MVLIILLYLIGIVSLAYGLFIGPSWVAFLLLGIVTLAYGENILKKRIMKELNEAKDKLNKAMREGDREGIEKAWERIQEIRKKVEGGDKGGDN